MSFLLAIIYIFIQNVYFVKQRIESFVELLESVALKIEAPRILVLHVVQKTVNSVDGG